MLRVANFSLIQFIVYIHQWIEHLPYFSSSSGSLSASSAKLTGTQSLKCPLTWAWLHSALALLSVINSVEPQLGQPAFKWSLAGEGLLAACVRLGHSGAGLAQVCIVLSLLLPASRVAENKGQFQPHYPVGTLLGCPRMGQALINR